MSRQSPFRRGQIAGLLCDHGSTSSSMLDSDVNEYKKLEPLARKQAVLLLSIQAAAAAHMQVDPQSIEALCQRAVRMIAQTSKPMVDADRSLAQPAQHEEVQFEALLASMLILSVYALRVSNWSEARVHREAASTLVNTVAQQTRDPRAVLLLSEVTGYLRHPRLHDRSQSCAHLRCGRIRARDQRYFRSIPHAHHPPHQTICATS